MLQCFVLYNLIEVFELTAHEYQYVLMASLINKVTQIVTFSPSSPQLSTILPIYKPFSRMHL